MKQPGTNCVARVNGNHGTSTVFVMQEPVTALLANDGEPGSFECGRQSGSGEPRAPAHAAIVMRWMPTNSSDCSGAPATSRQSSTASRIRCITSSRERACVWQPGSCGTEDFFVDAAELALNALDLTPSGFRLLVIQLRGRGTASNTRVSS
jgi:hypothetical protein